ncbi:Unknown protein sequence [Pseudomonas amygdali pv. lachrymans]|nr:Unknown protein sequence [Pseudomonas amygdali pv. lachrymans]
MIQYAWKPFTVFGLQPPKNNLPVPMAVTHIEPHSVVLEIALAFANC